MMFLPGFPLGKIVTFQEGLTTGLGYFGVCVDLSILTFAKHMLSKVSRLCAFLHTTYKYVFQWGFLVFFPL